MRLGRRPGSGPSADALMARLPRELRSWEPFRPLTAFCQAWRPGATAERRLACVKPLPALLHAGAPPTAELTAGRAITPACLAESAAAAAEGWLSLV
mmetsp:Transcript_45728/g.116997  ORF Transcript_45728/g.116997 Transcript_45728/m.116997 type:complete len:97 (+) Transcript_45728:110-400(+)